MNYNFVFFYKKNGIGYSPISPPTLKIINPSNMVVLNNQQISSLSNIAGLYYYNYSASACGEYIGITHTSDVTVDEQDLIYWMPNQIVQNIDEPISNSKNISSSSIEIIESAIWNSDLRTLTSYTNLVESIWGYNNKALDSFGNLIESIWGYQSRQLTINNETGEKIKEAFNNMIIFVGKALDEYYNGRGYFGIEMYYEKMARESINNI